MMKRAGIFLVIAGLFFGCNSGIDPGLTDEEQFNLDIELIDNWLAENNITDTLHHPTGIRYTINEVGTGLQPQVGDVVTVSYEGRFLETGQVFDSNNSFTFVLNSGSIILGWYYMVQEMKEGDSFTIYLPSYYGYGKRGNATIPPNTVLVFDIHLYTVGG